jgi:DNA-binding MarR family transcriptional regulator
MEMAERGVATTQESSGPALFDDFVEAVLDLMRAARRTGGAGHSAREDGISVPRLAVLAAIDVAGAQGVSAVADRAGLAQPTVTRTLAALERRGMVIRTPHASDGRTTCLTVTVAGRAVLEEKRREIVGRFAEVWATVGAPDRPQTVLLMRRLAAVADDLA